MTKKILIFNIERKISKLMSEDNDTEELKNEFGTHFRKNGYGRERGEEKGINTHMMGKGGMLYEHGKYTEGREIWF